MYLLRETGSYGWTNDMIEAIENLNEQCACAKLDIDSDSVLADMIEQNGFAVKDDISGISREVFWSWRTNIDKQAVEEMFYIFVGDGFDEYLKRCVREMCKANGTAIEV